MKAFTENRRTIAENGFSRVNPCQGKFADNNAKDALGTVFYCPTWNSGFAITGPRVVESVCRPPFTGFWVLGQSLGFRVWGLQGLEFRV